MTTFIIPNPSGTTITSGTTNPLVSGDNFHDDWKNDDLVTDVTYTPANATGYDDSFNVNYLVITPVRVEEPADSWGKYRRWVTSLQIPVDYMPVPPKPRDLVNWGYMLGSQGPVNFAVCKIIDTPFLGSPWAVTADYMDFQLELDDQVYLIQSTVTTGSSGARTVTDTQIGGLIQCAIEPEDQDIESAFGALTSPEKYRIYLNIDPSGISPSIIKVGYMFLDQNGIYYEIIDVVSRKRLDLLPEFKCVKKL